MPTIFRDKVVCGTVTFNDVPTRPAGAVQFGLDQIDGWRKSPSIQVRSAPYGGAVDGEEASGYWAANARHMTISGYVVAVDRAAAETLEDIITGDAFPVNQDLILVRYEGITRFMRVRVEGEVEILNVGPNNFRWLVPVQTVGSPFKFSYDPLAGESDTAGVSGISSGGRTYPRMYPLVYTTNEEGEGNGVTLVNHGTAPAHPIATLSGPLPAGGWRLENSRTGDFIQFDVGLTATDELVIDFAERTAMLNGYPVTSSISGDFWTVLRGANTIKLFAPYDAAAEFTISINSTWR